MTEPTEPDAYGRTGEWESCWPCCGSGIDYEETCVTCGGFGWVRAKHADNRPDNTGLDDGPYLPGRAPRKPLPSKTPEQHAETRAKAWATRRARYGDRGHA